MISLTVLLLLLLLLDRRLLPAGFMRHHLRGAQSRARQRAAAVH
jgi:hypothetical protein